MKSDIREVLNDLLVNIFNHILSVEEAFHKQHGIKLSMSEIHTLEAIDRSEGKTMGEVAKRLRITQGTLTVNINRLTNKGYVYRVQDENDRRIYRLKLMDKSKHVLSVHQMFHDQLINEVLHELSDDEKALLVDSLGQVNTYFENLIKKRVEFK